MRLKVLKTKGTKEKSINKLLSWWCQNEFYQRMQGRWMSIPAFIRLSLGLSSNLFDMRDLWFPAFGPAECLTDGCVYTHTAVYEIWMMMDDGVRSKGHEPVNSGTPYISIHLLLMQQAQLGGCGTHCWRPIESQVVYHVEFEPCMPAAHGFIPALMHICFFRLFHNPRLHIVPPSSVICSPFSSFLCGFSGPPQTVVWCSFVVLKCQQA